MIANPRALLAVIAFSLIMFAVVRKGHRNTAPVVPTNASKQSSGQLTKSTQPITGTFQLKLEFQP